MDESVAEAEGVVDVERGVEASWVVVDVAGVVVRRGAGASVVVEDEVVAGQVVVGEAVCGVAGF